MPVHASGIWPAPATGRDHPVDCFYGMIFTVGLIGIKSRPEI